MEERSGHDRTRIVDERRGREQPRTAVADIRQRRPVAPAAGLALPPEPTLREEEDRARDEASTAGIDAIDKARHQLSHRVDEADINANAAARVIGFYRSRLDGAAAGGVDAQKSRRAEQVERALRLAGLRAEREKIFEMARHSQMSHETSRKLVREIDLMETRYR